MAVFKYADLALAHLKPETLDYFKSDECVVCNYAFQYGVFVYVVGDYAFDMEGVIPSDLCKIFKWAKTQDVIMIKFDEEGFVIDELPLYGGKIPLELEPEQIRRCCK